MVDGGGGRLVGKRTVNVDNRVVHRGGNHICAGGV